MKHYNLNFPKIWMTASLALLGLFLVLFLKKTYEAEKADLVKEVGYVFIGAVRKIEGNALDKLVRQRIFLDDPKPFETGFHQKKDSVRVMAFFENKEKTVQIVDEKLEIRVDRRVEKKGLADMSGSISMVVELNEHEAIGSDFLRKGDFLPKLTANFDSAMTVAGLPIFYKISSSHDSVDSLKNLIAGTYSDLASGEQFSAQILDYQWFVIKKMWPNVLFSVAVFGLVALAFWSIWQSLAAQKKMILLKNDLLQNISHELKTPISTVSVAIEALSVFEAARDPVRTHEYLEISKNELARLSLLVDKVLGMAQFEKEAMPMQMAVFDVKKMVNDVLAAMKLQFEKTGAVVHFECPDERFDVAGDQLHLSGVVFNLLDNALKYSVLCPQILVKLTKINRQFLLEITDNGPGIPTEFREKIFEKFFRIPTGERHDVKGHGLGLSYAAEVVRLHGGQIWAEGSSFFVKING